MLLAQGRPRDAQAELRHSSSRRALLTPTERRAVRPVYPVGSDPDATRDYRDDL